MKFGIEFVPMNLFWRTVFYTIQAEKLGYEHVWITDHFNNRNVYVTLTLIANYTEKIKLGPGVTNPYLIHPVMTAQAVASLNEIAPGRVVCGIGAGDKTTLEMAGLGMRVPIRTVREAVEIIKRMVARKRGSYEGRVFKMTGGARFNFRVQETIPIYIGAQGPMMLRLAGSIADGVLINGSHPQDVVEALKHVRAGVEKAGRDLGELDIAAYTSLSVAEEEKEAKKAAIPVVAFIVAGSPPQILERHGISVGAAEEIKKKLAERRWGDAFSAVTERMIEAFSICGTPRECIEKIDAFFKLGVTQFVAGSPLGPKVRESIDLFGREVIPHFQD